MDRYFVLETDRGIEVASLRENMSPEEHAVEQGGFVLDPGPYDSYEEALDAMLMYRTEEDEED